MTNWKIVLTSAEWDMFRRTDSQLLLRQHFDVQTNDEVSVYIKGSEYVQHRSPVVHVLQNIPGIERGWLVITLKNQEAADYRSRYEHAKDWATSAERSNRSLRGQITKLRKRIGGAA